MHTQLEALRPASSLARPRPSVLIAPCGAALFGIAMAFSTPGAPLLISTLSWAVGLPLLCGFTWLTCLPALYVPWAARAEQLTLGVVVAGTVEAFGVLGTCLGATAPIQWFFAATAPESGWLSALGFAFALLALNAGHVAFGRSLEARGVRLPRWVRLSFLALFAATFFQFAHAAGLEFFPG